MWNEIRDESDLHAFMEKHDRFHDSCVKELKYISGAYVDINLSMRPINEQRILRMIIQRQFKDPSVIEMEFIGLKRLSLFPVDEKYDCVILEATMALKDDCFYWTDRGGLSEDELRYLDEVSVKSLHLPLNYYKRDPDNSGGILICASRVRWRAADEYLGPEEVYIDRLHTSGC